MGRRRPATTASSAGGGWANIKPLSYRRNVRPSAPSSTATGSSRAVLQLKRFRAVATRFEKHDANYLALVKLAA